MPLTRRVESLQTKASRASTTVGIAVSSQVQDPDLASPGHFLCFGSDAGTLEPQSTMYSLGSEER